MGKEREQVDSERRVDQDNAVTWYYVELPYATFAIEVNGSAVTEAPPIARWMVGRLLDDVKEWIKKKEGKISVL